MWHIAILSGLFWHTLRLTPQLLESEHRVTTEKLSCQTSAAILAVFETLKRAGSVYISPRLPIFSILRKSTTRMFLFLRWMEKTTADVITGKGTQQDESILLEKMEFWQRSELFYQTSYRQLLLWRLTHWLWKPFYRFHFTLMTVNLTGVRKKIQFKDKLWP